MRFKSLITGLAMAFGIALVAPAAWAQSSASASANASATVIDPITVASNSDLDFGSFEPGTGGTVVVTQAGVGSETGGVTRVPTGNATTAAGFDVTGQASFAYDISTAGSSTTLTSGGDSMALTLDAPASSTLDGTGADSFGVGGTLTVASGQPAGSYSGTVNVTVTYQ